MPPPNTALPATRRPLQVSLPFAMALATLGVAIATGFAFRLTPYLAHADLGLIFLAAVLFISAGLGLWPSLYGSILSLVIYNFFFTAPYHSFDVGYNTDLVRLALFLLVATVTGQLAARMRAAVETTRAAARRTEALYEFSRRMAAVVSTDDALEAMVDHLAATLGRQAAALLPDRHGKLEQRAASADGLHLAPGDLARAQQVYLGRTAVPGPWWFVRLQTARGPVGLAAIALPTLSPELAELTEGLCGQAAVAVERTQLARELEDAHMSAETEQLRAALLTSLSHDLREPLFSIRNAADELLAGGFVPAEVATTRLREVRDQADRLTRYLQSLLDMTRVGEGRLPLRRISVDLREVIDAALNRLTAPLHDFRVVPELAELPPAYVHAALLEQALVNVLDNAARYSPPGGSITVRLTGDAGHATMEVIDQGPGFPAERGPGLGLTIARALVGAHAGDIVVEPGPESRGTTVRMTLPLEAGGAT